MPEATLAAVERVFGRCVVVPPILHLVRFSHLHIPTLHATAPCMLTSPTLHATAPLHAHRAHPARNSPPCSLRLAHPARAGLAPCMRASCGWRQSRGA